MEEEAIAAAVGLLHSKENHSHLHLDKQKLQLILMGIVFISQITPTHINLKNIIKMILFGAYSGNFKFIKCIIS